MLSELIQNEETGNHIIAFEIFKFNPIKKISNSAFGSMFTMLMSTFMSRFS